MNPVILYRNDIDWKQEESIARQYFKCIDSRTKIQPNELVIPRFCALPFFKELETDINYLGAKLINNYNQHRYLADIGNWYYDLHEFTPKTWDRLEDIPDEGPFILKGETNSMKFLWNSHMFANNKNEAIEIYSKLSNDSLLQYQKIYIREYIPLEKLTNGLQGLPISKEYRFFIYKNTILSGGFYWSSHSENLVVDINEVPVDFLNKIIHLIQDTEISEPPNFYVIDVAKTQNGDWIVIELNDGTMSGLSDNNPDTLYKNLFLALSKEN